MILYLGVSGVPESLIPLEFETIEEARDFGQEIGERYMESDGKLFMAIEISDIYEELDIVYQDNEDVKRLEGAEIGKEAFDHIVSIFKKGEK